VRSQAASSRLVKILLIAVALAALALAIATLFGGPRSVSAQDFRLGLPAYVLGDPAGSQRVMFADSSISLNTICPVRKARVDPNRDPVYVNGKAVAFCCHPCPSVFSQDPERYLREMKVALRCPVNPARRAIFDSSLRMKINQDIFFFSSRTAMKRFEKDPLRFCGKLTDPVTRDRFRPTSASPHVTFRGRMYFFAADSTLARFQAEPEKFYERLAGT
jgi:YHS domain-containing protein